ERNLSAVIFIGTRKAQITTVGAPVILPPPSHPPSPCPSPTPSPVPVVSIALALPSRCSIALAKRCAIASVWYRRDFLLVTRKRTVPPAATKRSHGTARASRSSS